MRHVLLAAGFLAALVQGTPAQETGDPAAGRALAREACADCHAVEPGEGDARMPGRLPFEAGVPLPFEDIARTTGVTGTMLVAWLSTSHPTMPNIVLDAAERADLVAYILSLRGD